MKGEGEGRGFMVLWRTSVLEARVVRLEAAAGPKLGSGGETFAPFLRHNFTAVLLMDDQKRTSGITSQRGNRNSSSLFSMRIVNADYKN